jgi:hypothetical protein
MKAGKLRAELDSFDDNLEIDVEYPYEDEFSFEKKSTHHSRPRLSVKMYYHPRSVPIEEDSCISSGFYTYERRLMLKVG